MNICVGESFSAKDEKKLSRKIFTAIDLEIWSWKVLIAKKCGDIAKEYI